jgi:hypothetical protein
LFVIDDNRGKRHRVPPRDGEAGCCGSDRHISTAQV